MDQMKPELSTKFCIGAYKGEIIKITFLHNARKHHCLSFSGILWHMVNDKGALVKKLRNCKKRPSNNMQKCDLYYFPFISPFIKISCQFWSKETCWDTKKFLLSSEPKWWGFRGGKFNFETLNFSRHPMNELWSK